MALDHLDDDLLIIALHLEIGDPAVALCGPYEWALHQRLSQGSLLDVDEGSEAP
jgi:hypothetical protein